MFYCFLDVIFTTSVPVSSIKPLLTTFYIRQPERTISEVCPRFLSTMDRFFRRHFKRKEAALHVDAEAKSYRQRRPSVAVPTSKARRRSNVGLPSSTLIQRRRSSVQLPGGLPCAGLGCLAKTPRHRWTGHTRRRSSTTTPNLNPRFAVCRRKVGKLRTIDTHLLGPSMLLASLIQMAEEDEEDGVGAGLPDGEQQVEVRGGANNWRMFSRSSSLHSDGDSSDYSTASDSQSEDSQLSEVEQLANEGRKTSWLPDQHTCPSSTPSPSDMKVMRKSPQASSTSRPLIRAPRCLRRNSSQVFGGDSAPYSCYRTSYKKRRRISTISKAGSPWPGRGPPLPSRKNSVYYLNHPAFYRGPGALSPFGAHGYDSHLESWSGFLLYVTHDG